MFYIGLMTGTSLDGVDAVLLNEDFSFMNHHFVSFPENLRREFLALNQPTENELERSALAAWTHANLSAQAVLELLKITQKTAADIIAIGAHGQTIRHVPQKNYTIQLHQPARIAELTNITVVADFRARDIAAGGQGAPLAPVFQQRFFRDLLPIAVVNVGGIANVSLLEEERVSGFDVGPGNCLLDFWIERNRNQYFDNEGNFARSGSLIPELLTKFLADEYFQKSAPKSTGRDYFNSSWLQHFCVQNYRPEDVQRTLLELTAMVIAAEIPEKFSCVLTGGGARNVFLCERVEALIKKKLTASPIPFDALEAAGFAWLAAQCLQRQPLDLYNVTGGKNRVLGAIYPH